MRVHTFFLKIIIRTTARDMSEYELPKNSKSKNMRLSTMAGRKCHRANHECDRVLSPSEHGERSMVSKAKQKRNTFWIACMIVQLETISHPLLLIDNHFEPFGIVSFRTRGFDSD